MAKLFYRDQWSASSWYSFFSLSPPGCPRREEEAILGLRDRGVIADDVMRRIQRDLDLETMLLETNEPVIEPVSEVPAAIDAASR